MDADWQLKPQLTPQIKGMEAPAKVTELSAQGRYMYSPTEKVHKWKSLDEMAISDHTSRSCEWI
jgi:hypothetical protein